MQTLFGFDYGKRRIGIAVGQDISATASALCTLPCRGGEPDWDKLTELMREWSPGALVVGLPLHADGSDSGITGAARRFARQLEGRYHLPVHLIDERLSSHAAREIQQRGAGGGGPGIDAMAATVILQDWLDATRHS